MRTHTFLRFCMPLFGIALFSVLAIRVLALAPTGMGGPPNGQIGVPIEAMIDRQFDAVLDPASVSTDTVLLQVNEPNEQGGTPTGPNLCGVVGLFGPDHLYCEQMQDGIPMDPGTWYTFTISTAVTANNGADLLTNTGSYTFQTSNFMGGADFISPAFIVGSVPRAGMKLPINAKIRVYFEPGGSGSGTTMQTNGTGSVLSPDNVKLYAAANGQPVNNTNLLACTTVGADPGYPSDCNLSWTGTGNQLIITPGKISPGGSSDSTDGTALVAGNEYVLIVQGMSMNGSGVMNTDGIPLGMMEYYVPFTATGADLLGPTVKGTFPQNSASGVNLAINNITIGFSEAVEYSTVTESTIQLYRDDGDGLFDAGADTLIETTVVEYLRDKDEAILSPSALLTADTKHFVVVSTGIQDLAGKTFDGDRATGGNQTKMIAFKTGNLINGANPDATAPRLEFAKMTLPLEQKLP